MNLFSGDYYAAQGVSAQMRTAGRGVIDVDADDMVGGGVHADMTAASVFSFLNMCIETKLICGVASTQPCGSGSAVRFREDASRPDLPVPSRDGSFPDGFEGLSPLYQKEVHKSKLLSFRTTRLMKKAYWYGGWYFAECPSMRGDEDAPLVYDPTFHAHSSVARDCYWLDLVETTGGIKVDAYMCMLRAGYPPKPEGFILSPNLGGLLHQKLSSLACCHPAGTHTYVFSKDPTELKKTATWLPELCSIIRDGVVHLYPLGGCNFQLGVDDIADFAMQQLGTKHLEHYIALECTAVDLLPGAAPLPVTAELLPSRVLASVIRSEDYYAEVCSSWMQYAVGTHPLPGEDINPRLEREVYGILHEADGNLLEPLTWELYGEGDACMVVLSQPVSKQPPPQTEIACVYVHGVCVLRGSWLIH